MKKGRSLVLLVTALLCVGTVHAGEMEERLEEARGRQFAYLRRQLTPSEAERVTELGIRGVHLQREYRRYYPSGEVFSHVLGFTNVDDRGQEGLELACTPLTNGDGLKLFEDKKVA